MKEIASNSWQQSIIKEKWNPIVSQIMAINETVMKGDTSVYLLKCNTYTNCYWLSVCDAIYD